MRIRFHLTPAERLAALCAGDHFRRWRSLDDQRFCVLCQRTFSGRQVRIKRDRLGRIRLECPTKNCKAAPNQWLYPHTWRAARNVYHDWWRAVRPENGGRALAAT
jgi:hypothetical protein